MREIKFRGRIAHGLKNAGCWIYWGINGTDMLDAIDGDTIGQLTGLKDKNDQEIYEDDIVVYRDISGSGRPREFGPRKIRWYRDSCNFNVCRPGPGAELEVVGNIHENSELLK